MMIKENYAQASIKEIFKYKINQLYKIYCKYVELYDFSNLIQEGNWKDKELQGLTIVEAVEKILEMEREDVKSQIYR